MCLPMMAVAQGSWQTIKTEADELKEQTAGQTMVFHVPDMGSFVCWGWDDYHFRLNSEGAIFNTERVALYIGLQVLVGLYDANGTMKEKFKMWLDLDDSSANKSLHTRVANFMSTPSGQKGKVKKIFNTLLSGQGYVRIVAERYNAPDFDIKITPY